MVNDQIDRVLKLVEENNQILRSMRRTARIGAFIRFVYWMIIVASLVGSYYFIQPYIDQLLMVYNELNSSVEGIKAGKIPNLDNINLSPEVLQKLDALLKNK